MLAIANVSRFIMAGIPAFVCSLQLIFPITGIAVCCARAASGHVAALP
jgi:hypothetical protein